MHVKHDKKALSRNRPLARQLDLNLLELFDTVYQTRNLTTAGGQLGLSQPAVSRGLARLRQTYDDSLFVRQQRGVAPTPLAEQLAAPIAAALEIVRGTIDLPTFDPATHGRTFRIAMSDIGERYFLPRLLRHLAAVAPGVGLDTVSPPQPELMDGLGAGQIHLAVGFLRGLGKQVHEVRLLRERYVYVARQGHPQVRRVLRAEDLRTLPHVVAHPAGTHHGAAVEKALTSPRVRAPIALRVSTFLSVGPIVADTDLVAALPSNLAALVSDHLRLQVIEPPLEMTGFDVCMAWHQRLHRDPGVQWLRQVFSDLFGSGS